MPLFDTDFLKKLEYLAIVSRRVFRGQLLAQQRTRQLGTGIEFADHRDYTPGDDFRHIDWSLYARHDELLLKRFQEEEDLHLYLMLDCSPSMGFGRPPKFNLARQMTAALGYMALSNLDRIAVIGFADGILADYPLTRGKAQILGLMRFLDNLYPAGHDTSLASMVKAFVQRQQRRGVVIVISDLFDPHGFEEGLNILRHHQYEPHVLQLFDAKEADPPLRGELELLDMETNQVNKVTITERGLKQYKKLYAEFMERVQRYCRQYGMGCTVSPADVPFDELILRMLRESNIVRN
ncbi:MAG: DUF58 domain-containing protein [Planctomyces sp.]|nr:DUF58 domain-containing protein [Planctomyces sp.]